MDLSAIKEKLHSLQYKSSVDFVKDFRLMISNCRAYNQVPIRLSSPPKDNLDIPLCAVFLNENEEEYNSIVLKSLLLQRNGNKTSFSRNVKISLYSLSQVPFAEYRKPNYLLLSSRLKQWLVTFT